MSEEPAPSPPLEPRERRRARGAGAGERAAAEAATVHRGRRTACAVAALWLLLALVSAVRSLFSEAGNPLVSFALLALTAILALAVAAGSTIARWAAVFFTSAHGVQLLQSMDRVQEPARRAYVIAIALFSLAVAAVLLFDPAVAAYGRSRSVRRRAQPPRSS